MKNHDEQKTMMMKTLQKHEIAGSKIRPSEPLQIRRHTEPPVIQSTEKQAADLSIRLSDPEQQKCYEAVREFRDIHGYPMFSPQWAAKLERQLCPRQGKKS